MCLRRLNLSLPQTKIGLFLILLVRNMKLKLKWFNLSIFSSSFQMIHCMPCSPFLLKNIYIYVLVKKNLHRIARSAKRGGGNALTDASSKNVRFFYVLHKNIYFFLRLPLIRSKLACTRFMYKQDFVEWSIKSGEV